MPRLKLIGPNSSERLPSSTAREECKKLPSPPTSGDCLAASGYRVLLVDMDPQGNLAEDLGYTGTAIDDAGHALAASLTFGGPLAPSPDVRPNLDVLIGGHHLDAAAAALSSRASKDTRGARLILAQLLAVIAGNYDLVLIDCPPGNEPLQAAAAAAARWALVPVKTDQSSQKGPSRSSPPARRCRRHQPRT